MALSSLSSVRSLTEIVPSHRGFTLIELLVVIAIIAILAAILFPVFAQAREKARQSACLSNTKQIGLGFMQYAQDYDEVLPFQTYLTNFNPTYTSTNAVQLPKWMDMIYPYVKSEAVFSCPNIDSTTQNQYVAHNMSATAPNRAGARYGTYGANTAYFSGMAGTGVKATPVIQFVSSTVAPTSLADIQTPASTIAATEMFGTTSNATISWSNATTNPVLDKTTKPYWSLKMGNSSQLGLRHSDGANAIWCDGHSKWARGEELAATRTVNGVNVAYLWTIEED